MIAYCLLPFLWIVVTSLKPREEVFKIPPTYLPHTISLESYINIFAHHPFLRYILNSIIIAGGATCVCILTGSLAAYAISRIKVKGREIIQMAILAVALFPPIVFVVPLFSLIKFLGLINNPFALILPYAALNLPLTVWILVSFFNQIPADIEDAARVDGFSRIGILTKIMFPLCAPALATTAILVFIFCWNEFLFAFTFMIDKMCWTVPVGIANLSGVSPEEIPWDEISSAVVLTTLPVVLLVIVLQRKIVEGLTAGAVKG
jgi:multiple sugar transport system permease protein